MVFSDEIPHTASGKIQECDRARGMPTAIYVQGITAPSELQVESSCSSLQQV
jgi:hypothetical protein